MNLSVPLKCCLHHNNVNQFNWQGRTKTKSQSLCIYDIIDSVTLPLIQSTPWLRPTLSLLWPQLINFVYLTQVDAFTWVSDSDDLRSEMNHLEKTVCRLQRIYWQRVGINLVWVGEYNTAPASRVICLCLLIGREIVQVIDLQHKMKKGRTA